MGMIRYFQAIRPGKVVLWCYLIWYLVTVAHCFDPSPSLWLNSVGISGVIGVALMLSVAGSSKLDRWQTLRLFLMPFCVSSFSSLIKGRGYFLIFPTDRAALLQLGSACALFLLFVFAIKQFRRHF